MIVLILNGCWSLMCTPAVWYRGYATYASSNRLVWELEFDDGDLQIDVPAKSIRPYLPYQLGEMIEVRLNDFIFGAGKVVGVDAKDDSFNVEVAESGIVLTNVQPMDIRRQAFLPPRKFAVGDRVQAMFPGGGHEYYMGTVTAVHRGAIGIEYDDGDYIDNLPLNMVQPSRN